jgi:DNA-binding MarR family transcriptional regulator
MRAVAGIGDRAEPRAAGAELPALLSQLRLAMIAGVEDEFLRCAELAELEVSAAQFAILKNVLKGSAESACDLCRLMDYDRGAMSRMVDRLESKGLLRRVPLAHTRRSVALEVTAAGRAAFPVMEGCLERVVARLVKGVSKAEIREFTSVLKRMLANA